MVANSLHEIRRGLDLKLVGAPEQRVDAHCPRVTRVGVLGADFVGLRPRLLVEVGDVVRRGQPLFEDRAHPEVKFVAPGAGIVERIVRGERRSLRAIGIALSQAEVEGGDCAEVEYPAWPAASRPEAGRDALARALCESGLWTAFRTRPFGRVPRPGSVPRAIFVTATDTRPFAPDPDVAIAGSERDFCAGLAALRKLSETVHLCMQRASPFGALAGDAAVSVHEFVGPHPAGLPGLHMNLIDPVNRERVSWHVGYQDVIAMGSFLNNGRLPVERVIALAGSRVEHPRLLRTRMGASIADILSENVLPGVNRILSGSVLCGRDASDSATGFLGRYHLQVTVLRDEQKRDFLGWLAPKLREALGLDPTLARLLPSLRVDLTSNPHGEKRPLVPIGRYERVWPYDAIPPTFLFRAMLSGDAEAAEELGILELDEEDVALCGFVCPSKIEFGHHLRDMLTSLEKDDSE